MIKNILKKETLCRLGIHAYANVFEYQGKEKYNAVCLWCKKRASVKGLIQFVK